MAGGAGVMKIRSYPVCGLIAVFWAAGCAQGDARDGAAVPEYREIPEAAAACGLNRHAVVNRRIEGPRNIMVLPLYDNTTQQMREAKSCLRRWAAQHGYLFLENESRGDD